MKKSDKRGASSRGRRNPRTLLSLFTGAGGLDLGLEEAGFEVVLCVERDRDARETIRANRRWPLLEIGDVHDLKPHEVVRRAGIRKRQLTMISAGPPCQPFSKASYWISGDTKRLEDPRAKTLEAVMKIVEAALPRIVLLENVPGISYEGKSEGKEFILDGFRRINRGARTKYRPKFMSLNAAHYGVPQLRTRVFILAERGGAGFQLPGQIHGTLDAVQEGSNGLLPFRTAWDAIGDLDKPYRPQELELGGRYAGLLPSIPEGQNYLWHTPRGGGEPLFGWRTRYWSFLLKLAKDRPSWTIPAAPGPSAGPFHWRNRLLSIREMCRLQTFPDDYEIKGSYRSAQRQIGNAVPPLLAEFLGLEIRRQLLQERRVRRKLRLAIEFRPSCPRRSPTRPVSSPFLALRGNHPDHPGTGKGPSALRRKDKQ